MAFPSYSISSITGSSGTSGNLSGANSLYSNDKSGTDALKNNLTYTIAFQNVSNTITLSEIKVVILGACLDSYTEAVNYQVNNGKATSVTGYQSDGSGNASERGTYTTFAITTTQSITSGAVTLTLELEGLVAVATTKVVTGQTNVLVSGNARMISGGAVPLSVLYSNPIYQVPANISLVDTSIQFNAGSNHTSGIYTSVFAPPPNNNQLEVPIKNSLDFEIQWSGSSGSSKSKSGSIHIYFPWGDQFTMDLNSLCSLPKVTDYPGLSVQDWDLSGIVTDFYYDDGTTASKDDWGASMEVAAGGASGAIVLASNSTEIDWTKKFSIKISLTEVVSGNTVLNNEIGQTNSMLFVQSGAVPGVNDTIDAQSFALIYPTPTVDSFTTLDGSASLSVDLGKPMQVKFSLFGASYARLQWMVRNGSQDSILENLSLPVDIDLTGGASNWSLTYKGAAATNSEPGYTTNPPPLAPNVTSLYLSLFPGDASEAYHDNISVGVKIDAPTLEVDYQVRGVVTNPTSGDAYIVLQWKVTDMADSGYCMLNGVSDHLPGSTNGGQDAYLYLLNSSIASNLTLSVYDAAGTLVATKKIAYIDNYTVATTVYDPSTYGANTGGMTTYYATFKDNNGKGYFLRSTDGLTWVQPPAQVEGSKPASIKPSEVPAPPTDMFENLEVDPIPFIPFYNIYYGLSHFPPSALGIVTNYDQSLAINGSVDSDSSQQVTSNWGPYPWRVTAKNILPPIVAGLMTNQVGVDSNQIFYSDGSTIYAVEPTSFKIPLNTSIVWFSFHQFSGYPGNNFSIFTLKQNLTVDYWTVQEDGYTGKRQATLPTISDPSTSGVVGIPKIILNGGQVYLLYIGSFQLYCWRYAIKSVNDTLDTTAAWSLVFKTPSMIQHFSMFFNGNDLTIVYANDKNEVVSCAYDVSTDQWKTLPKLSKKFSPPLLPGAVNGSNNGMALCTLNGVLYLVAANATANGFTLSTSVDGVTWSTPIALPGVTVSNLVASPGLATDGAHLYLAYVEDAAEKKVVTLVSTDLGKTWGFTTNSDQWIVNQEGTVATLDDPAQPMRLKYVSEDNQQGSLGAGLYLSLQNGTNGYLNPTKRIVGDDYANYDYEVEGKGEVNSALDFCYYKSSYYLTYVNALGDLILVSSDNLLAKTNDYTAVSGFPASLNALGNPQLITYESPTNNATYLFLIYTNGAGQVAYTYTSDDDASSWASSVTCPIAGETTAVSLFYDQACIAYLTTNSAGDQVVASYLLSLENIVNPMT